MQAGAFEETLSRIHEVDGVSAVALFSNEGLLVGGLGSDVELDSMAALGAQVFTSGGRLVESADGGPAKSITVQWQSMTALLHRLSADLSVIVLLQRRGNAGYLGYLFDLYSRDFG